MRRVGCQSEWIVAVAVGGLVVAGCGGETMEPSSPIAPVPVLAKAGEASGSEAAGGVTAQDNGNRPPNAVFRTDPRESSDGVLGGVPPFTVTFNMCQSTDPDPGDRLRYTLDFDGDGVVNIRGTCRLSHTYEYPQPAVACVDDRTPFEGHRICKEYQV